MGKQCIGFIWLVINYIIVFSLVIHIIYFSGHVIGLVIYTGKDTRSVLNTNNPKSKVRKCGITCEILNLLLYRVVVLTMR